MICNRLKQRFRIGAAHGLGRAAEEMGFLLCRSFEENPDIVLVWAHLENLKEAQAIQQETEALVVAVGDFSHIDHFVFSGIHFSFWFPERRNHNCLRWAENQKNKAKAGQ